MGPWWEGSAGRPGGREYLNVVRHPPSPPRPAILLSALNLHCFEHIFPFQHHEVAVADAVVSRLQRLWAWLLPGILHAAQRGLALRGVPAAPCVGSLLPAAATAVSLTSRKQGGPEPAEQHHPHVLHAASAFRSGPQASSGSLTASVWLNSLIGCTSPRPSPPRGSLGRKLRHRSAKKESRRRLASGLSRRW